MDQRDRDFQTEQLVHDAQAVGRELGRLIQRGEQLATATVRDGAGLDELIEHTEHVRKALGKELADAAGLAIRSLRLP